MVSNTYSVLNAFTGAADAVIDNHILTITGAPPMDFRKIEYYKEVAVVAGTPGVYTVALPATATTGSTYILAISQFVKALGKVVSVTIQYTAPSAVADTVIVTAWKQQLTALSSAGFSFTVSGTTTLILTATAPNNWINVTSVGTGTGVTVTASTPPVSRVGNGADLLLTPVGDLYGTTNFVSTNSYKAFEFTYGSVQEKSTAGENALQVSKHIVFANTGGANYAAFNTALTGIAAANAPATGATTEYISVG
jgi:hypothetical protein